LELEAPVIVPEEPGNTTDLFETYSFELAFQRSLRSPYLLANIVYVIYAIIIINIDVNEATIPTATINSMYIGANLIHLTNGMMYMWVWYHEGFRGKMLAVLLVPEFLNLCEASLYISSSTYYNSEGDSYFLVNTTSPPPYNASFPYNSSIIVDGCNVTQNGTWIYIQDGITADVQNIEITASLVAMCAAFGWTFTWYLTYRRIPGRGWTLDDPDIWAMLTILLGDVMYIIYNAQIISDRSTYGSNYLYVAADWVFVVNSWCYMACALRDAGWFFLMPVGGRMHFDEKYVLKEKKEKILKDVV